MEDIPKVNETYNSFDDGKIRTSRLYTVDVKEVIPFNKIDKDTYKTWLDEVARYYWIYAKKTDYFIKTDNGEVDEEIFVRATDGGWFSIGRLLSGGRLDVSGKLTKITNAT